MSERFNIGVDVACSAKGGGRLLCALATIAVCLTGAAQDGWSFEIGNVAGHFCHERITLDAFRQTRLSEPLSLRGENLPTDAAWVKFADYLEAELGVSKDLTPQAKLVLVTLFVGVRYPDQAGYAVHDLQNLRELHLAEDGQEEHFLRALHHDGPGGDAQAVKAGRDYIWSVIEQAREAYFLDPDAERTLEVKVWFPHYGAIDILVWAPLFHLGKALHTIQDSFTHTVRSDDTMSIYAVANFAEGLSSKYNERRDGLRHSEFADNCRNPEVAMLVDSATDATAALMVAAIQYFRLGQPEMVDDVLDTWMGYTPGCGYDEGYCDSVWVQYLRREPTLPLFSCATTPPPAAVGEPAVDWTWLLCLMILAAWRRQAPR